MKITGRDEGDCRDVVIVCGLTGEVGCFGRG